jgi:hypothetical protein
MTAEMERGAVGFRPPMSVAETLLEIHQNSWVLSAIQWEFV